MALIVGLAFWLIGIPLFYGVAPWAISWLTPRYGWEASRPGTWNLLGPIPVIVGNIGLFWGVLAHSDQTPRRIDFELNKP